MSDYFYWCSTYTLKYCLYCLGLYDYAWHLKLLQSGTFLTQHIFFYHSAVWHYYFNQDDNIMSSQSYVYIVTLCSFPSLFFIHIAPQNIVSSSHHLTKFDYYDQSDNTYIIIWLLRKIRASPHISKSISYIKNYV